MTTFTTVPVPSEQAYPRAWTLMSAFAAATSRSQLSQMSGCMAYRNPMYLAKVAATVDAISGGRTEMGIGAGWYEHEWRAYGYGFPSAGTRLAMLDEGVQIMRSAWADGMATFAGEHYQVDGAICTVRRRCRPGRTDAARSAVDRRWQRAQDAAYRGEVRAVHELRRHARHVPRKSAILADHCRDVGTDYGAIVRSANYNVIIGRDDAEVEARTAAIEAQPGTASAHDQAWRPMRIVPHRPSRWHPRWIVETLRGLEGDGMTYAITYFQEAAHDTSGIELFAAEVIPALAD